MGRQAKVFDRYGNTPCPGCREWKPREEYPTGPTSTGIVGSCYACRAKKQQKYNTIRAEYRREEQREKVRRAFLEFLRSNPQDMSDVEHASWLTSGGAKEWMDYYRESGPPGTGTTPGGE